MHEMSSAMNPVTLGQPRPFGKVAGNVALHALAAAFMCICPLLVFVPAVYISSSLKNGRAGAWGAVFGSAAILAIFSAAATNPLLVKANLAGILGLLLVIGIPSVAAAALIRRGQSFGLVLLVSAAIAIFGLFATELGGRAIFEYSPYEKMLANFQARSAESIELSRKIGLSEKELQEIPRLSAEFARSYFLISLAAVVITTFALSMVILPRLPAGQLLQSSFLLRNLAFPDHLLFAFVAGGLSPLLSGPTQTVGYNLLGIVGFLYILQGLAIFRSVLAKIGFGLPATFMAMLALALLVPLSLAALFLAGLFDPFIDFRNLNRKDDSDESDTD